MTLAEAKRTFAEGMKAAREGRLSEAGRRRLSQARQVLRRAKRPAMNAKFKGGFIVRSYYGRVEAGKGTLLGGVRVHESSRFKTFKAANSWLETIVDGNIDAGRDVASAEVVRSPKNPEIENPLTRRKARTILHERQVRGYPLTERQRRMFGARALGYPVRKNPTRDVVRLGRTTEIRYKRDIGSKRGFYKHEFRTSRANLYTISEGWVYVPGKAIVITEGRPHV